MKKEKKTYTLGSLFAGIGGIDLAFQQEGFEVRWANEIDQKACTTYARNFSHQLFEGDIKDLTTTQLPSIDILTAGFPCQPFSIAGYRKGLEDHRGGAIFFELMRFVKELSPRIIFLENVKNLKSHDKGRTFEVITDAIKKEGYKIKSAILNTCEYSELPQNRERVYIVCFKDKKTYEQFSFPSKIDDKGTLASFIEKQAPATFYYKKSKIYTLLKEAITKKNTCYQWRRKYVRENKSNVCPTLTANMGTGGHNVPLVLDDIGIRKLTPRECAKLQGFPPSFVLPQQMSNSTIYKQLGNSVSVPVVQKIAKNLLNALNH